jgi:CobQ-like glutamine amidotransferase family enzyme
MGIYGDRGNILALIDRARRRGIELEVDAVGRDGDRIDDADIFFIGGGQDIDQGLVADDLAARSGPIREALENGAGMLAVCGGYQLLGAHYTAVDGSRLKGAGLLDLHTEAGQVRSIGNVVVEVDALEIQPRTIVGFENHAGRTFLGPGLKSLGRCLVGGGNNGEDGHEGVVTANVIGTYVHGALLPKNPHLTDHLLQLAARHRQPDYELAPLDAREEMAAHQAILARVLASRRRRSRG